MLRCGGLPKAYQTPVRQSPVEDTVLSCGQSDPGARNEDKNIIATS